MKNSEYCSQKIAVRKGDKEKQVAVERCIFGMLMSISNKKRAAVNLEVSLVYFLANHPPALCVLGGAPRKLVKSKLYDAALKNLYLTDANNYLERKNYIHTS